MGILKSVVELVVGEPLEQIIRMLLGNKARLGGLTAEDKTKLHAEVERAYREELNKVSENMHYSRKLIDAPFEHQQGTVRMVSDIFQLIDDKTFDEIIDVLPRHKELIDELDAADRLRLKEKIRMAYKNMMVSKMDDLEQAYEIINDASRQRRIDKLDKEE